MRNLPLAVSGILLALLAAAPPALALGCCFPLQERTFRQEAVEAHIVFYGILENPQPQGNGGTTDLRIETVIKDNPWLGDKKVITIDRLFPVPNPNDPPRLLVFCDVHKGKIDPYRGVPVKSAEVVEYYLRGAMGLTGKEPVADLLYFACYLENPDEAIARDAFQELSRASDQDVRAVASKMQAKKLRGWLKDAHTPTHRLALYALMLGEHATEENAALLRSLLDDAPKRSLSGVDGILAGYTLAKPKEGWAYIQNLLKDPSKDFTLRHAALRAVRFFWESRPDVIEREELAAAVCLLLPQDDIADLAIEDLRKWKQWNAAGRVLALRNGDSFNVPIIRRAILRYALSCPTNQVAEAFVNELRKKDARLVRDAEELLKLENAVRGQ